MSIQEYQEAAHKFACYGDNISYPFAGLAEETGEVLGKFAKFIRKHDGIDPKAAQGWAIVSADAEKFKGELAKELGDVCWMVSEIATQFGLSLEGVMAGNVEKLTDRANRGVIVGEGDNR